MNHLVISSYPPARCGIGAYAEQQVADLRCRGETVNVLALPGGDGDFVADPAGVRGALRLLRILWAYDRITIQFTPPFFYRQDSRWSRHATSVIWLFMAAIFGRRIELVMHEGEYTLDGAKPRFWSARRFVDRWTWRLFKRLIFHSARERDAFADYYRINPDHPRFEIEAHDRHFMRYCSMDQEQARAALGLNPDKLMFLCIGFIQPHKGYDRAVRAFARIAAPEAMLRIVGSVRIDWEPAKEYARSLHEMAASDPRCAFVETFPSKEQFDAWIVAADYVVVPYHLIWSSGVAARARLYDKPLIVSDAGGLREQMIPGSHCFRDDEELYRILEEVCRASAASA